MGDPAPEAGGEITNDSSVSLKGRRRPSVAVNVTRLAGSPRAAAIVETFARLPCNSHD
jgi:hypothetical protein